MKKKLIRLTALLVLVSFGFLRFFEEGLYFSRIVYAHSGGFEVTFLGDELSGPIFEVYDMMPGDCEEREVLAKNLSSDALDLFVKSAEEMDTDNLSTQLDWKIMHGPLVIYQNTLKDFFDQESVLLGQLLEDDEKLFVFQACFKTSAGNEYQNTKVKFSLKFSTKFGETPHEIPEECSDLNIKKFIIGNGNNNHLFGSSQNDFIDGRGGNDHIWGMSGHDCLVGGEGNDKILGGSGADVILGNQGNDDLRAESGDDTVYGGTGNDDLRGGSGDDKLYGQEGNDNIRGGSGTDLLDGGPGNDNLHGGSGNDTCVFGESQNSCEI